MLSRPPLAGPHTTARSSAPPTTKPKLGRFYGNDSMTFLIVATYCAMLLLPRLAALCCPSAASHQRHLIVLLRCPSTCSLLLLAACWLASRPALRDAHRSRSLVRCLCVRWLCTPQCRAQNMGAHSQSAFARNSSPPLSPPPPTPQRTARTSHRSLDPPATVVSPILDRVLIWTT